jgi:hypothetical protein
MKVTNEVPTLEFINANTSFVQRSLSTFDLRKNFSHKYLAPVTQVITSAVEKEQLYESTSYLEYAT